MTEMEILAKAVAALQVSVDALNGTVGALVAKAHTPIDCPLTAEVKTLQLSEARRGGMLAVIGFLIALVASGLTAFLARVWGK